MLAANGTRRVRQAGSGGHSGRRPRCAATPGVAIVQVPLPSNLRRAPLDGGRWLAEDDRSDRLHTNIGTRPQLRALRESRAQLAAAMERRDVADAAVCKARRVRAAET